MPTLRRVTALYVYDGTALRPVTDSGPVVTDPDAPNPPQSLDYTPTQTSLTFRWDAPDTGAAVDVYEWRVNGGGESVAGGTSVVVGGLTAGTVYLLEVRSVGETGLRSDWASLTATTTAAPPDPSGYSMLWGYTVGTNGGGSVGLSEYNRIAAHMGPAEVIRDFSSDANVVWPPKGGAYAGLSPQPVFVQSFKPSYSAVMSGSQDAYYLAHANKLPTTRPTCVGAWHEWDVKKYGSGGVPSSGPQTEAQYAALQHYLADLYHSVGNPMIRWAPILGEHNYKARWDAMLAGGLDMSKFDYVLYDPYRSGSPGGYGYSNGYNQVSVVADYLKNTWGMPYERQGIAEIGVGTTPPPSSQYAAAAEYGRGAMQAALDKRYWCICWFEEGPNSYMIGNPPGTGPALAARPQILSMWQTMRAANP